MLKYHGKYSNMLQRLDKFLSDVNLGTRKEIRHYAVKGLITVDGVIVKDVSAKFDFDKCTVEFDGEKVEAKHTVVCALNKPAGYVSSTDDPLSATVMELVPEKYLNLGVVPVGRLDKDTEGILLFTNDGQLLHRLISPKNNVPKTYYAQFDGSCPDNAKELFANGITLKDGSVCKPAEFEKLSDSEFRVTITEGMYHQVKRMAAAVGMHITYLNRESFANIKSCDIEKGHFIEINWSEYEQ